MKCSICFLPTHTHNAVMWWRKSRATLALLYPHDICDLLPVWKVVLRLPLSLNSWRRNTLSPIHHKIVVVSWREPWLVIYLSGIKLCDSCLPSNHLLRFSTISGRYLKVFNSLTCCHSWNEMCMLFQLDVSICLKVTVSYTGQLFHGAKNMLDV